MEFEVHKEFVFDSAHFLPDVPPDHRCRNVHGHTYRATVYVRGRIDDQVGWVCDYGVIKASMAPVLKVLDHHCLNEVEGLRKTTTEHLAAWIWERIAPNLPGLSKIVIHESNSSGITYWGPKA